jgi:hypothetical protein
MWMGIVGKKKGKKISTQQLNMEVKGRENLKTPTYGKFLASRQALRLREIPSM